MIVLIVEDEAYLRDCLRDELEQLDSVGTVHCAGDGVEGLRIINSGPVDLVFSDIQMPNMNGLELLKLAKQAKPDLRFVLMTGNHQFQGSEVVSRGALTVLPKPFDLQQICDIFEAVRMSLRTVA